MALAHSKITAQGKTSVPSEVRKRLGVGPGGVLEWSAENERIVVRRSGQFTSEDIHKVLFHDLPPKRHSLAELKAGIAKHVQDRHPRH